MVFRFVSTKDAGFLLPLSLTGSLVLLLSSLSIQSLLLHARHVQAAEHQRLQGQDQLASAAQQVALQLQGRFACLQPFPMEQWEVALSSSSCPAELDLEALLSPRNAPSQVRLTSWEPFDGGGQLQLQQHGGGPQSRYPLDAAGVKELG